MTSSSILISFRHCFYQVIRTTVWTKHDSRIRSDELTEAHDMEENDENELRRRRSLRNHSNNEDNDAMEMKDQKQNSSFPESDENSRVPLMSSSCHLSSNDSMTNPGY